jgi:hypothetical protein
MGDGSLYWPPEFRWATLIVGTEWPDGDEIRLFEMAQYWLDAADSLEKNVLPLLTQAQASAVQAYEAGDGADAIKTEMQKLISGDNSVEQLAQDYRQVGTSARHMGTTIEETKMMIIISVTILIAQIIAAWLWPPTAPVVEATAIGACRAAVYRIAERAMDAIGEIEGIGPYLVKFLKILRSIPEGANYPGKLASWAAKPFTELVGRGAPAVAAMAERMGADEALALSIGKFPADLTKFLIEKGVSTAVWSGGGDAFVQVIQIAKGHRDGFDWTELGMSVAATTGGWYAGAFVAENLEKYGGKLLGSWGLDATRGFTGMGLGFASGTVPTVISTLVGGGIQDAFTGTFSPQDALIGTVASNSMMGLQRGYIGELGARPGSSPDFHAPEVEVPTTPDLLNEHPLATASDLGTDDTASFGEAWRGTQVQHYPAMHSPDEAIREAAGNQQADEMQNLAQTETQRKQAELALVSARARAARANPDEQEAAQQRVEQAQSRLDSSRRAASLARANSSHGLARRNTSVQAGPRSATAPPVARREVPVEDQAIQHPDRLNGAPPVPEHRNVPEEQRAQSPVALGDEVSSPSERSSVTGQEQGADVPSAQVHGAPPVPDPQEQWVQSPVELGSEVSSPSERSSVTGQEQGADVPSAQVHGPPAVPLHDVPLRDQPNVGPMPPQHDVPLDRQHAQSEAEQGDPPPVPDHTYEPPARPAHEQPGPAAGELPDSHPRSEVEAGADMRKKLAALDNRLNKQRSADDQVTDRYNQKRLTIDRLSEQRRTDEEALTRAKDASTAAKGRLDELNERPVPEDEQARATLGNEKIQAAADVRIRAREVENREARMTLTDRELSNARTKVVGTGLAGAVASQAKAAAAVRKAQGELDEALVHTDRYRDRRQAELDELNAAHLRTADHQQRIAQVRERLDELNGYHDQVAQRRALIERLRAEREDVLIRSGSAEVRARAELASHQAISRRERGLLPGGYFSGKPRAKKMPLDESMPDPFVAVTVPPAGFWGPGLQSRDPKHRHHSHHRNGGLG